MQEFYIAIHAFSEMREFIDRAANQPFEIFVGSAQQLVDAKGFIGTACLDFSRPLKVLCNCDLEHLRAFRQQVSRFLV